MRQAISATTRNHVIPVLVNLFRDLDRMAHVLRLLNIDLALRCGEDRLNFPSIPLRGLTGAAVGIDENLDALLPLGIAICTVQEAGNPGRGEGGGGAGGGVERVVYVGNADG